MNYEDGTKAELGDVIQIPMLDGPVAARVVMLGDTSEHLRIDERFRTWVAEENLLNADSVVVEWLTGNPLAHDNPACAPVGDYMFTRLCGCVLTSR